MPVPPFLFSVPELLLSTSCGTFSVGSRESTSEKKRESSVGEMGRRQRCDSVPKVCRRADIVRRQGGGGLKRGCLSLYPALLEEWEIGNLGQSPLMHCKANFKQTWPLAWWLSKAMLHAIGDWSPFSAKICLEMTTCTGVSSASPICQSFCVVAYECGLPYVVYIKKSSI